MAGLTLRTLSLAKAEKALHAGQISFIEKDDRLIVPAAEAVNAVLEFVE